MAGRVPLARKNLLEDRRRAVLAVGGVATSLVLVLVLDGVFAGAMHQVNAYMRNSPADVFVAQPDVRTMHMTQSALPPETVDRVAAVEGVAWAEGLRYTTSILEADAGGQLTYVLGYDTTTGRGGPRRLTAGQAPGPGEVLIDDAAAHELSIGVGDAVSILGSPVTLRVSGLSTDGTNIGAQQFALQGADRGGSDIAVFDPDLFSVLGQVGEDGLQVVQIEQERAGEVRYRSASTV